MQAHQSTFEKGINRDVSIEYQPQGSVRNAVNCSVSTDGKAASYTNISGSTNINIPESGDIAGDVNVLGVFDVTADSPTLGKTPAILMVYAYESAASSTQYRLKACLIYPANGTRKEILGVNVDSSWMDVTLDGVTFGEGGVDTLYAGDAVHPLMKIIADETVRNLKDISLLRFAGSDVIKPIFEVVSGGSLKSGSYQFSLQLVDTETGRATTWTPPSTPIGVRDTDGSNVLPGNTTQLAVKLTFNISLEEDARYNAYRLAVIANTAGVTTFPTEVSITPLKNISGSLTQTYTYTGNEFDHTQSIDEITVPDAAIKTARTVSQKNNHLLLGGVEYHDFPLDNGVPSYVAPVFLVSPQVGVTQSTLKDLSTLQQANIYNKMGYFRGELYRFAVIYHDEYGNWGGLTFLDDIKFPNRNNRELFFNSSATPVARGVRLQGIQNHPSWARGMAIVRAKRKKDILFQSPLIHHSIIEPAGASGLYPTIDNDGIEDEGAQLGDSAGTRMNKCFSRGYAKHAVRKRPGDPVDIDIYTNPAFLRDHEVYWESQHPDLRYPSSYTVFPPEALYQWQGAHLSSDKPSICDFVDYAKLKSYRADFSSKSGFEQGEYMDTSVSTLFGAFERLEYGKGNTNQDIFSVAESMRVFDFNPATHPNVHVLRRGSTPTLFGNHQAIQDSWNDGIPPTTQNQYVITTDKRLLDPSMFVVTNALRGRPFGSQQVVPFDSEIFSDSGGILDAANGRYLFDNAFCDEGTYQNILPIVNLRSGLGDDRYGDPKAFHEYVFTGSYRALTKDEVDSNLALNMDVWGGDCFIGMHHFKVNDSAYAVTHGVPPGNLNAVYTDSQMKELYGRVFKNNLDNVNRIVPLRNVEEIVSVYLESEVNSYMAYIEDSAASPSEGSARVPFTYDYNLGYSAQNAQRIFVPEPEVKVETSSRLGARIHYSDIKIAQTQDDSFSRFRAANFFDMEEAFGDIYKLSRAGDSMFCLQEDAWSEIPIQSNIIQTDDGSIMSVRNADVVGRPWYITTNYGSKLTRSVIVDGSNIVFADGKRGCIIAGSRGGYEKLSDAGMYSFFRTRLGGSHTDIWASYDPTRGEYLFGKRGEWTQVFNKKVGWVSEIVTDPAVEITGAMYLDGEVYLTGLNTSGYLVAAKMYVPGIRHILNGSFNSYIDVVINPEPLAPKVFDNIILLSDQKPGQITATTTQLGVDSVTPSLEVEDYKEGTFRVKILRTIKGRLRGSYAKLRIELYDPIKVTHGSDVTLHQILTKYRVSERAI